MEQTQKWQREWNWQAMMLITTIYIINMSKDLKQKKMEGIKKIPIEIEKEKTT